jgi:polyisoprenoid-binding protein YceI
MRTRNLLFNLLLVTLLAAACARRETASAESAPTASTPPQQGQTSSELTLSAEAAEAFAQLPAVSLDEGQALRTFHVDPTQSKAAYIVNEELFAGATSKYGLAIGKTQVIGETQDVVGLLQLDLSGSAIGANRFAVYLPTLRTDQKLRDGWIRQNALQSDRFPVAEFVATQIIGGPQNYREGENARFQLAGELTLRGITLPTVWDLSASLRDGKISGRVETRLRMTDLGFDPPNFANTLTVADEFTVRIDFVAKEQ